ncbi:unnamed protein product [Triticum turgidum subsp. durum]|uniref:Purple acid phosphatase N-terminal domain-containing protein n=1 Tax=Triticum turgidum subsp. durum TaxID=4567 RepID=A0A9R1B3T8_TRITD|nr:unnamed protein product [Triticum turgidum subsp. durum]
MTIRIQGEEEPWKKDGWPPRRMPYNLKFDTKYYYAVGTEETLENIWFRTPPKSGPNVPYTFRLIGDLSQSFDSNVTLAHYESNSKAQAVLFVGT